MKPERTSRVGADPAVCAGSGLCSHIAPSYFDSSGGVVKVLREDVADEDAAAAAEAVSACPAGALRFEGPGAGAA